MQSNKRDNTRQILNDWEKYVRIWNPKTDEERVMLDAFLRLCLSKLTANEVQDLDSAKMQQTLKNLNENKITLDELGNMDYDEFYALFASDEKETTDEK